MNEAVMIIAAGCTGILIGTIFGYIWGFDVGYKKSDEWHEKENKVKVKYSNTLGE